MLKIMKADLYKTFHRPYLYVFTGVLALIAFLFDLSFTCNNNPREVVFQIIEMFLFLPLFISVIFADIIMSEENKHGTMKNTISFGIGRNKLYLSKLLTALLLAFLSAVIILGVFIGNSFLLLNPGKEFNTVFNDFLLRLGATLLIAVGGLSLAMLLAALFKKNSVFVIAYAGFLMIPTLILKLLGPVSAIFSKAALYTLFGFAISIGRMKTSMLYDSIFVMLGHVIVFTVLGLILFRRQEIN